MVLINSIKQNEREWTKNVLGLRITELDDKDNLRKNFGCTNIHMF
jgi:hypothetical protein